jgi:hypothetical protein
MGVGHASISARVERNDDDHPSTGPSDVSDQSYSTISLPVMLAALGKSAEGVGIGIIPA